MNIVQFVDQSSDLQIPREYGDTDKTPSRLQVLNSLLLILSIFKEIFHFLGH